MAQMTNSNGSPLSVGPIPSGRLKNPREFDIYMVILEPVFQLQVCQSFKSLGCTCAASMGQIVLYIPII